MAGSRSALDYLLHLLIHVMYLQATCNCPFQRVAEGTVPVSLNTFPFNFTLNSCSDSAFYSTLAL